MRALTKCQKKYTEEKAAGNDLRAAGYLNRAKKISEYFKKQG